MHANARTRDYGHTVSVAMLSVALAITTLWLAAVLWEQHHYEDVMPDAGQPNARAVAAGNLGPSIEDVERAHGVAEPGTLTPKQWMAEAQEGR